MLNQTNKISVNIEDEMKKSYMDYAMSVIIGRALPDVRDGFKPVHRRCLYAMYDMGNDYNKPYKKSARVVGDVIGKYHPHGDTAAYDTIVRMAVLAQEFLENCTPGYYNNEGKPGERSGQNGFYGGGSVEFFRILQEWRATGELKGLELRRAES